MTERDAEGKALDLRLIRVIRNMAKELFGSLERDIDSYGLSKETFQILEKVLAISPDCWTPDSTVRSY